MSTEEHADGIKRQKNEIKRTEKGIIILIIERSPVTKGFIFRNYDFSFLVSLL
uniref:Uncharacterized protein n=1 Tax=Schistosoma japonicum TaxID=6182 RepID=Q5BZ51_SCHJA|nr:unknown [Schistosoma japonicum]